MTYSEFKEEVDAACKQFSFIKEYKILRDMPPYLKIRLEIAQNDYVDVVYNSDTGSTSYTYISDGKRLFGANTARIGWHIHPYENEKTHKLTKPVSLEMFLRELELELKKRGKL